MPDATYDAVVIGGGNKALFLAMYLARYGGMSVGIFERRHEVGGCLANEEAAAPGFVGNTHASIILPWYWAPLYRDFPEFEGYGAKFDTHRCSDGAVFRKNQTCLTIYSYKHDPTQERTAREIARFSERDAELWLKIWGARDVFSKVTMDTLFDPAEMRPTKPGAGERQLAVGAKLAEIGLLPDAATLAYSPARAAREVWESKEVQYVLLRFVISSAMDVNQPGQGTMGFAMALILPTISFTVGGTHQAAHAAHKILLGDGVKIWTHCEVDKVIMENGTAKGIRLTDGSEIGARKLVVSTLSPRQLCFDLIGREHLNSKIVRRIELLEETFGCIAWYTWALHEPPKYEAAQFNPDVNETYWLGLAEDNDPAHLERECYLARLGKMPPLEDFSPVVWCHSLVDPSYAPPGKHTANHEHLAPPASWLTEREWIEFKKQHAEDIVSIWQRHAPNMTWDNIIGHDGNTPYDNLRMKNLAPNGCMAGVDRVAWQVDDKRPIPELANHRTPIKNLYATGGAWHVGSNAGATESYNCYKIIAEDLGLAKPWLEPEKEEPDSLIQEVEIRQKRLQESVKVK